jgi:hypothetical protein
MKTCQLEFEFNGDSSHFPLEALAEWSDTHSCYHVKNIRLSRYAPGSSAIPDIFIKCIKGADRPYWVHSDSNRPSSLSEAVGKAIEAMVGENEIRISDHQEENEWADPE